jgi:phosphohistidine phosphatase
VELLVIRHAAAVERIEGISDADDAARPLTERGRRRFRRVVRGLRRLGLDVERVLHSPWTRAVQTADLLDRLVDGDLAAARRPSPSLAGPPRAELFADLAAAGGDRVAVIGHEPWLGELVTLLVTGATHHADALPLRKGGVAWLDGDPVPGGMRLRAFLPPRVLRRVR